MTGDWRMFGVPQPLSLTPSCGLNRCPFCGDPVREGRICTCDLENVADSEPAVGSADASSQG